MEGGTFHIDAGLIASSHYRMKRGSSRIYGRQYDYPDAQYFGCGGGRKQIVDVAKEKAQQNVNAARRYLHNNVTATKGPIYKKYLGAFTPARLEFVQNRFSDLYGSFYSNTKWYCNCTGSAVSYTISGIHSEWHLCKGFWNAPTENTARQSDPDLF
ncbi:hypothetical protein FRC03_007543 [Tulasnella sp. 419]|nr:hypothetical protein FRC03_007543 [Tulasnella sp. 419]